MNDPDREREPRGPNDMPSFGRVGGIDDPVARAEYGDDPVRDRERPHDEAETVAKLLHGQRVRDRESDDDSQMLVLRIRARTAAREHYIDAIDQTVAEANPEYPPHDPVVEVAFITDIEDALGINWNADNVLRMDADGQLNRARINRYAYPISRLAGVEDGEST